MSNVLIKKNTTRVITFTLLLVAMFMIATSVSHAYTRLTAGSVWNHERMLEEFGSPQYSCLPTVTCQDNQSTTVRNANSTSANAFLRYMCVNGNICQDRIDTELKYVKSLVGPGSRLGRALIPSVTSVRIYDSSGNDVTYEGCVQPGERFEFILSSEHRTCGTRALMTHYEIEFEGQTVHTQQGRFGQFVNNFTGGFTFTAPLLAGTYHANIAVLNPYNPWYYRRGFLAGGVQDWRDANVNMTDVFFSRLDNPRGGYYTYELGQQTVNVCEDSSFRASCIASPIHVMPGADVTFTARAAGGVGPYTYEWGDGDTRETKTVSYDAVGSGTQTLRVTDSAGNRVETQCSVTVTTDLGFGVNDSTGSGWRWEWEWAYADPAEIVRFGGDRLITNDTCRFEWETTGMVGCRMLSAGRDFFEVDLNGSMDLSPGTYTLECIDELTFDTITSQPVRCLSNPDLREI